MSKVLLIDDQEKFHLVFSINFRVYLDAETTIVGKWEMAQKELLKKNPPNIIVCRYKNQGKAVPKALVNFLSSKKLNIPVIILGNGDDKIPGLIYLDDRPQLKEILQTLAKELNITAKMMADKDTGEYYPISTNHLVDLDTVFCDIYSKSAGPKGEMQVFCKANNFLDQAKIDRMISQEENYVFIKSDLRAQFANFITSRLNKLLEKQDTARTKKMDLLNKTMDYVGERLIETELSEETIRITQTAAAEMVKLSEKDQTIKTMMAELLKNPTSYRYRHSQLITFFSSLMLDKLDWSTLEQKRTIGLAAFFHDIMFKDDRSAKIHTMKELDDAKLDETQSKIVLEHAKLAAQAIKKIPKIPIGTDQIVEQHHGSKNGVGFPQGINPNINMITRVFMVAEELATLFLDAIERGEPFNHSRAMIFIKDKFSKGSFLKIIDALQNITL